MYIKQHSNDAKLLLDDLKELVQSEGEQLSKRVLHYASSLRGSRQFWYKQRSRLIIVVDTLSIPIIFFAHCAADGHWPNLARLVFAKNTESSTSRSSAMSSHPAVADCFFMSESASLYKPWSN